MGSLNTAKDKFINFLNLPVKDKIKTVLYSVVFIFFLITFRLFGYKKVRNLIDKIISSKSKAESPSENFIKNESKIIGYSAENSIFSATCLEKSLFSYFILGLYGINCDLKIGVNNASQEFSAHAWIEHEGQILNDTPEVIKKISPF